MEKIEVLKQAKRFLDAKGCTVQELSDYCAEEQRRLQNLAVADGKTFVMEVMYEGFVRSNVPLKGLKPLGIIWKNWLITLQDASEKCLGKKLWNIAAGLKSKGRKQCFPVKSLLQILKMKLQKKSMQCA